MKSFKTILILFILICQIGNLHSQSDIPSELETNLVDEGFKNICVVSDSDELIVFAENFLYRSDIQSIAILLKQVYELSDGFDKLSIIILESTIPILYLSAQTDDLNTFFESDSNNVSISEIVEISYNVDKYRDKIIFKDRVNSSRFFSDIIVHPDIGFQLGNYENPFRFQLNLKSGIYTSFWRGQELGVNLNIPLLERKFVDKFNYFRAETVTFNQFFKISNAVFGRFSVGMFTNQRYGFDFESSAWLLNGKVMLNANIAYTGYMAYLKTGTPGIYTDIYSTNVLEKGDLNYIQYFGNIEYRFSKYDLGLKLGYGEYLYHNRGFSVEMMRNFNEFIIGFRGVTGDTGNSLEAHLIIPLIPNKYLKAQKLRVRMANYYDYYHPIGSAYYRSFSSGNSIERMLWDLNPQFIKNNLDKFIRE